MREQIPDKASQNLEATCQPFAITSREAHRIAPDSVVIASCKVG